MRRVTVAIAGAASAALLVSLGPSAYAQNVPTLRSSVPAAAAADCKTMPMSHMDHDMGGMGHEMGSDEGGMKMGHSKSALACQAGSEYLFLIHMIPHHAEAVDSAKQLKRSERAELRKVGKAIIKAQTAEIKQMKAWLKEWYPGQPIKAEYEPMMPDLSKLSGDALDEAFIKGMIGHHQHAVAMAKYVLKHHLVKHKEFGTMARAVRDVQQVEIKQMKQWQKEWFGSDM